MLTYTEIAEEIKQKLSKHLQPQRFRAEEEWQATQAKRLHQQWPGGRGR